MSQGEMTYTAQKETPAVLCMLVAAIIISFSSVFVRLAHVSPTMSGFYRVAIGGVILLFWVLLKRERLWAGARIFWLNTLAALFFALDLYAWHRSIIYVGPGLGTILPNLQVFILAAAGVLFLHERITLKLAISAPLAILGLMLVVGIEWETFHPNYKIGILWGLAAALFYASFTLTLRKLQAMEDSLSPMVNLMWLSIIGAVMLGIDAWAAGESFRIPDRTTLFSLLGLGFFSQVVGWMIITTTLPKIRASLAGLLLLLQPTLAFVWDMLIFQRETTLINLIGIAITLSAIYMGSARKNSKK
jgi:drug/metabolite transporter (DMT)-like permease